MLMGLVKVFIVLTEPHENQARVDYLKKFGSDPTPA